MVAIVNNVETLLRMKRVDRRPLTTQSYGIRTPFNLRLKMVQLFPVFGRMLEHHLHFQSIIKVVTARSQVV